MLYWPKLLKRCMQHNIYIFIIKGSPKSFVLYFRRAAKKLQDSILAETKKLARLNTPSCFVFLILNNVRENFILKKFNYHSHVK